MKKKILSVLLCGTMLASSLAGCGGSGSDDSGNKGNEGTQMSSDNSGEVETINVYTMTPGVATNYGNVVERINEITKEEIGVEVNLTCLDMGQYFQQYFMLITGGEEIDLIAGYYDLVAAAIQQGAFMELDDLVAEYGTDIVSVFPAEYLEANKVNGKLYGIPTRHAAAREIAFEYNKDITDELGIDVSSVKSFSDWEKVMEQVHAAYPDMMCLTSAMGGTVGTMLENNNLWDRMYDNLGVVLYDNPDEVVNLYETDVYKELCLIMQDWNKKGYIQPDAASTSDLYTDLVKTGKAFSTFTAPEVGAEVTLSNSTGVTIGLVDIETPKIVTEGLNVNQWNIPVSSAHAAAAVKFLNLLETNAELADLLAYGEKGVNYQVNEDGTYGFVDGEDAGSAAYHPNFSSIIPNRYLTGTWTGELDNIEELSDELDARADVSPTFGFSFDAAAVANEMTACNNVVSQYAGALESGSADVETVLPEFIQALKEAGIDTVVTEKQRQYSDFLNSK